MALSDNERYTLKLKALRMLYNDNFSQTEIAEALNISRVTLNKLLEEAKNDGMVRIDVIDIRNTGRNLSAEIELYKRFNLRNVILTDCTDLDEEKTNLKIAKVAAEVFDRYITNDFSIGVTWGRTTKNVATMISERQNLRNVTVYSLVGTTCDSTDAIQSSVVAQIIAQKLHGSVKIVTAPFLCSNAKLCKELKNEAQISYVLNSVKSNDINIVGIGRSPERGMKSLNTLPLNEEEINELADANAVGDIGGNFFDINGKPCKANINNRIVTISLDDLRKHNLVMGVGGGKGKARAILGALRGGFIDVLVTDVETAGRVLELCEEND